MNADAAADTAVLVSAVITLLAIAAKLITANLVTRAKRVYNKLDTRRRELAARLKEVQLKRTSARGTLEFWERRRAETSRRVADASRDLETYTAQFSEQDDVEDETAADSSDPQDETAADSSEPQDGGADTAAIDADSVNDGEHPEGETAQDRERSGQASHGEIAEEPAAADEGRNGAEAHADEDTGAGKAAVGGAAPRGESPGRA